MDESPPPTVEDATVAVPSPLVAILERVWRPVAWDVLYVDMVDGATAEVLWASRVAMDISKDFWLPDEEDSCTSS